ncbi:MAG: tetratricopeptide repeat protein, partial [Akkermansiaceae bacterium]|nr:tetratricopeptide repeat protein [Akkermansiaceae bacterium]
MVGAHESPEHNIKHLTSHIETARTPDNLFQRAIAYRATGQLEKASADLKDAIHLSPNKLGYHLELSKVQLAKNKFGRALHSANHALKLSNTPNQRAICHMLRAEAYQRSHRPKPALQSCLLAFKEVPKGEIEWFLLRSDNQLSLGQHQQRIADLKTGYILHHSAVLKAHWIDAIIDASDFQTALPLVEAELADRRWKSSWLIKRARVLQGLKRNPEAS